MDMSTQELMGYLSLPDDKPRLMSELNAMIKTSDPDDAYILCNEQLGMLKRQKEEIKAHVERMLLNLDDDNVSAVDCLRSMCEASCSIVENMSLFDVFYFSGMRVDAMCNAAMVLDKMAGETK